MTLERAPSRRFNWTLALVLVLGIAVLGISAFALRSWRRQYLATSALGKGVAAYEARDWATAAREIGRYCALHPDDEEALLKYADAHLHVQPRTRSNVNQAISAYRYILRRNPAQATAAERVAEFYLQVRLPGEAEMICRSWLKAEDAPRARLLLSSALAAQKKSKEAGEELQGIIDTHPENIAAYQQLAQLMRLLYPEQVPQALGLLGSAVEEPALVLLRSAVERNPGSAEAHVALGSFLQEEGRTEDAKQEYMKALACDLSDVEVRILLASRLMSVGELKRAEEQLARAAEADPHSLALWQTWAALVASTGSADEVNAVARRALAGLGSEAFPFLETAADLFLYGDNEPGAESCLKRIEELDPESPAIPALRGKLADRRGNPREAIRQWQKALAPGASSPELRFAMAQAYERTGDIQGAIRELRRVVTQRPRVAADQFPVAQLLDRVGAWREAAVLATAQFRLAGALDRVGSWREAAVCASEAVRLDPRNPEAKALDLDLRARLAALQGQLPDASGRQLEAEADSLLQQYPDSLAVLSAVGNVAVLRGNPQRALAVAHALEDKGSKLKGALLEVRVLLVRVDEARARADAERTRGDGERARADEEQARADEEQALARLQATVADFPGEPTVVLNLANLLLRQKRVDEAIKVVESGARDQKGKAGQDLRRALATYYYGLGRTAEAEQVLKQLCDENPEDLSSRVLLLNILGPKDPAQSQQLVEEVKRIEGPDGLQWRFQQAQLWLTSPDSKKHMAEAVALLNANLRVDPSDLQSQLLLGIAQEQAKNLPLAIEAYRRAYEQAPTVPDTVAHLIGALGKANELADAGRVLDDAAARGVSADRVAGLRLALQQQTGQLDEAATTAEEMLKRDPENLPLKIFVATIKMRQGKFTEARTILEALDAGNPLVMTAKVDLCLREGKVPEGLALCDQLVAAYNTASAYLFRGRIRTFVGQLDGAEADYQKVTELAPKAANWVAYSEFLVSRGKVDDAAQAVKKALELENDNPAVIAQAVKVYALSTDDARRKEASALLERGLAQHPGDPALLEVQAQRLVAAGTPPKLGEARQALDRVTQQKPRQVSAWILTVRCSLLQALPDAALDAVSRGLASDPTDAQRRQLLLLKAEAEQVRWPTLALATLNGLWNENKKDLGVGAALARTYREAGDARKAMAVLEEMWKENRGRLDAGLPLAEAYRDAGDGQGAIALLQEMKGLTSGRELAAVNLALADTLDLEGRTDEGVQLALSTAEAFPEEGGAVLAVVRILARRQRWDEAYAELAKWQKDHPTDLDSLLTAARVLLSAGEGLGDATNADQAVTTARRVLEGLVVDPPTDVTAKQSLAATYRAAGLSDAAEKVYREVLQQQPDDAVVLNNLAWVLCVDKSRYEEALGLVNRALGIRQFANALDTRGVIYHRMGRLEEARKELEVCISLSLEGLPVRSQAEFHLAQVLRDQGRDAERGQAEQLRAQAAKLLDRCLARRGRGALPDALPDTERTQAEQLRSELNTVARQETP
jgi:tetratricopeptide (TPR) repeat protein